MNIDTDLQWAFWEGILNHYKKSEGYLQDQLGNPEGAMISQTKNITIPVPGYAKAKKTLLNALEIAFNDLNCINRNA